MVSKNKRLNNEEKIVLCIKELTRLVSKRRLGKEERKFYDKQIVQVRLSDLVLLLQRSIEASMQKEERDE